MSENSLGPCPICGREMLEGPSVDRHHWIPRREGGTDWDYLHRICHKKLHSLFDERTLAQAVNSAETARSHPDMESFIKWVRKQPLELIGRHEKPKGPR